MYLRKCGAASSRSSQPLNLDWAHLGVIYVTASKIHPWVAIYSHATLHTHTLRTLQDLFILLAGHPPALHVDLVRAGTLVVLVPCYNYGTQNRV